MESTKAGTFVRSHQASLHSQPVQATLKNLALEAIISEKAVVVFSVSTCCLCHTVKHLFCSLGVSPAIYELDKERDGQEIEQALRNITACSQALPAVFIGGHYVGGLDELIATHICGQLVPQLKEFGALWL